MFNEVTIVIRNIANDKNVYHFALGILLISLVISLFFSYVAGIIVLLNYIIGIIVCWSFLKYQNIASTSLQRLTSLYKDRVSVKKSITNSCTVCNNENCNRHELNASKHPWKNIQIGQELNESLENFYNKIIDAFILIWYKNITNDTSFVSELKYSLRYVSAVAVNKILELDTGRIITDKLVPCTIKHIDDYLCMKQICKIKNESFDKIAIEYLGKRMHVAATNRNNEVRYLRELTEVLLPKFLQTELATCRNYSVLIREIFSCWVLLPLMDVLADPNTINFLVIKALTKGRFMHKFNEPYKKVQFLKNFERKELKKSVFGSDLKTVLKTPQLLYAFMQFLKKEGYVHYLQFCLDIEEFNNKLITPDLNKKQLEMLHEEATKLYKLYLSSESNDFVGCPESIVNKLNNLLEEGVYNVFKLRTSEPLFQAFDFVFSILECEWLPLFYHSNEFYNYICGSKVNAGYTKARSPMHAASPVKTRARKSYESYNQGTVSKISSGFGKIKVALKTPQPIEGALYPNEINIIEAEPTSLDDIQQYESKIVRDISTWKVTIPVYKARQITQTKYVPYYNIIVEKMDSISGGGELKIWDVHRKDQDFYTLKSKLIEFHGENEFADANLPTRRGAITIDSKRMAYEDFLRKLLQKPVLKGSDLLYMFLTKPQDFSIIVATAAAPIADLGNIYQSVAYKLRKEKGQHLDSFMNTFLASTSKLKQSRFEWAETVDEKELFDETLLQQPKTIRNPIYNDNYGVKYKDNDDTSSSFFNPNGITESLFYLLKHTFKVKHYVLKAYAAICSISQQAIEGLTRSYIERKIKTSLSERNLVYLIGRLEDVVFGKYETPTKDELLTRKNKAFKEINNYIPSYLSSILGEEFKNGFVQLLEILQNPSYNKQLVYNLLDIIILEMYPNFDTK